MDIPRHPCFPLAGPSPAIRAVCEWVRRVAPADTAVLLQGESGTGKGLVARLLHERSPQNGKPLVFLDCSAATEDAIDDELFGTPAEPGAFRNGSGTLFLDEVGALPARLQGKLLRTLEAFRNGASHAHPRVVAATSRDLPAMVAEGHFRDDLYYRLAVVPIQLPPLRERLEDLTALIETILEKLRPRIGDRIPSGVSPAVLELFRRYPWPGNVRELESVIEFACLCARADPIGPQDLPPHLHDGRIGTAPLHRRVDEVERQVLEEALRGSETAAEAARRLGISRATIFRRARRHGVAIADLKSHE